MGWGLLFSYGDEWIAITYDKADNLLLSSCFLIMVNFAKEEAMEFVGGYVPISSKTLWYL